MALRRQFRRSLGNNTFRVNVTKTGLGVSVGVPGVRQSRHSGGSRTRTVGFPGTGAYWRDQSKTTPASKREGEKLAQKFQGVGTKGFEAKVLTVLQRFEDMEATVARVDPTDSDLLSAFRDIADECMRDLDSLLLSIGEERTRFIQWGESQAQGVFGLFSNTAADYVRRVHETATGYDHLTEAVEAELPGMRAWIHEMLPPLRVGDLVVCASGHENHASRTLCAVCGSPL